MIMPEVLSPYHPWLLSSTPSIRDQNIHTTYREHDNSNLHTT